MKEWICIYCGTTMSSKCPGQRSTFYNMETAMIRNALATHVLDVGPEKKEVFLNLSFWGKNTENVDPVIATIEKLSEWKDKLKAVTCNHRFILNSETRTQCQLGCKHYNLTDKEKLLAERTPDEEFKVTFEDVKKTYIDFLDTQMSLARENMKVLCPEVPSSDPHYDELRRWYFVFQDEMDQIKYDLLRGIDRLKLDQPYRKKYRVDFGWKSEIPNMYTDDILQAIAVYKDYQLRGVKCRVEILTHDKPDSTSIHYRPLEQDPDMRLQCCYCGERINDGEKLIAAEPIEEDREGRERQVYPRGHVMHAKCSRILANRYKESTKSYILTLSDNELSNLSAFERQTVHGMRMELKAVLEERLKPEKRVYFLIDDYGRYYNKLGENFNKFRLRITALGSDHDKLKKVMTPNKKEAKNG